LFNYNRKFAQSQGCQLTLSLAIINTIMNSVIIVHGPIGCGASLVAQAGISKQYQKLRDPNAFGLRWINTNLDEVDVISGGEEKLQSAILNADREYRPSAIIVMNSCVPALIGDDIDTLISELQKQVYAKIVPVRCEGFKTKIQATAYDAVYHGILRTLVGKEEEDEVPVIPYELEELKEKYQRSRTDEEELVKLLRMLELNVRILPCYAHPDDFVDAYETALNVSICATHDDYFVEHMKAKYGVPFILRTFPIGISNTNKWILDIARFFGMEEQARKLVDIEVAALNKALAPYREFLKGKTAFLAGGEIRILTTAELLHSLGLEILGLRGFHFDSYGENLLEELLQEVPESEKAIINIGTGQPFEQANLLENSSRMFMSDTRVETGGPINRECRCFLYLARRIITWVMWAFMKWPGDLPVL